MWHAIVSDGPSAWPALVKGLLVPRQSVRETVEAFKVKHNMAGGVPTLGFHLRCVNVDGDCSKGQVINACQCAYERLRALENATAAANGARGGGPVRAQLFLATMQSGVRRAVTSHFRKYYSREVISYGEAMEKQEASEGQERARLVDALIVAASRRGCVHATTRPPCVQPDSCRYCGSCVVLPEPVSPTTITHWKRSIKYSSCCRAAAIGSRARCCGSVSARCRVLCSGASTLSPFAERSSGAGAASPGRQKLILERA